MNLDADTWSRVSELFEQLAELDPAQRDATIERLAPEPLVREWLLKLLSAHDDPDELLIDRTVLGVAKALGEPSADEAVPPTRVGPWRILKEIGRGGMGRVMLGERADGGYEQCVAIKLLGTTLDGEDLGLLKYEVGLLARLEHPGIVRLIDADLDPEASPYLAMEYVEGQAIDHWCALHEATLEQRIGLLRQVADALTHAHRRLIVHADIKPSNVLVDGGGRARLLDFGIGRWLSDAESTAQRALRCSPGWCAPEQLQGAAPDVAQDVFGLGALALRLLTGSRVRDGSSITHWLSGGENKPEVSDLPSARALPGLPRGRIRGDLDAIVQRALEPDPERRYASIEALDQDLQRWLADHPVDARPLSRPARFGRWLRRNRGSATAAAIAMAALLSGLMLAQSSAIQARASATQARIEAQRADSVRNFVLDLFRAADPLRTGGAELSTREVLSSAGAALERNQELETEVRLEILNLLADVQRTLDWFDDADALLHRAEALIEEDRSMPLAARVETLRQRALLTDRLGDPDSALDQLRQALLMLEDDVHEPHLALLARLLVNAASIHARRYEFDATRRLLDRADPLLARLQPPLPELEVVALSSRAVAAYHDDEFELALAYLQQSLDLMRRLGNENQASNITTLNSMAAILAQLGRPDEAAVREREALEIARAAFPTGHHLLGRALYSHGDTLRQLGRYDEALAHLDEARAMHQSAGLAVEVNLVDLTRSRTLLARGDFRDAADLARALRGRLVKTTKNLASREALLTLQVELAARVALGDRELDALLGEAAAALERLPESQRLHSVSDLLRWQMADTEFGRGHFDQVDHWLAYGRDDAAVPGHSSVRLRWDALRLRQALQHNGTPEPGQLRRLRDGLKAPDATAEARAHAWCALAEAAQVTNDHARLAEARTALGGLVGEAALSRVTRTMVEERLAAG